MSNFYGLICILIVWAVMVGTGSTGTAAERVMFPEGEIRISIPGNEPLEQPPVTFSHADHERMLCGYCHHAFFCNDTVTVSLPRKGPHAGIHFGGGRSIRPQAMVALVIPNEGSYSCSQEGCHTNRKEKSGGNSFYAAFHAPEGGSCLNCHREEASKGNNSRVPVACKDCHTSP